MAERDARVTLEVTRQGDAGAVRETAADVEQLDASARTASAGLSDLATGADRASGELKELGGDATGAAGKIRGVGDSSGSAAQKLDQMTRQGSGISQLSGQLGRLAANGLAIKRTFEEAYEGTRKFTEKLKELGIDLDAMVQNSTAGAFFDDFAGWLSDATTAAEDHAAKMQETANAYKILQSQGIDPVGMSYEKLMATLEESAKAKKADADAAATSAAAHQKWLDSLGPTADALNAQADALLENLARVGDMSTLNAGQQEAVKAEIQGLLDQYARFGVEVPPHIQQAAASWNVMSTAAAKAAADSEAAAKKISAALIGEFGKTREELQATATAIEQTLSGIDLQQLKLVDPAQFEEAQALIQQIVDQVRMAGGTLSPEFERIAGSVGVFLTALDVSKVDVFAGKATDLSGQMTQVVTTFDAAGNAITTVTDGSMREAGDALDQVTTAAGRIATEGSAAPGALEGMGTAASSAAPALSDQATAAGESATQTGDAATQAQALADAQNAAATASTTLATNLGTAAEAAPAIATALQGSVTALTAFAGIDLTPVATQLDAILTKARAVNQELDAMNGGGGGGGPATPPSAPTPAPGGP